MLSKNSVVQCVSNLLRGSSTFFFSATFRHTDEESLIDIFCNLIALGFTRIRSGSLGFDRSLERERDTRDTKNFRYKNTVVNTVFIPFYIHPPPRQYIYSRSHHGNPPWNNLTPKQYVVNFFKCRSVLSLSLSLHLSLCAVDEDEIKFRRVSRYSRPIPSAVYNRVIISAIFFSQAKKCIDDDFFYNLAFVAIAGRANEPKIPIIFPKNLSPSLIGAK